MKRFITMILAIVMVITSVVVPMDKVKAAENEYVWEQYCGCPDDGSYSMTKRLIIGYDNNGRPITNNYEGISTAYYDANGNMVGLKENGVWVKCIPGKTLILPNSDTIDDDGTHKTWDTNGNLIAQQDPDGTYRKWDANGNLVYQTNLKEKEMDCISVYSNDSELVEVDSHGKVITCKTLVIAVGCESQFNHLECPLLNKAYEWSSDDSSIVSVDKTGYTITGKKIGKTALTLTVLESGQQVKVPVKVVKNECSGSVTRYGTRMECSVSYDTKGNLICKLKFTNKTNKKKKYTRKNTLAECLVKTHTGKKEEQIRAQIKKFAFTLKPGKSKTVTIKVKKSKLKGKHWSLPESGIYVVAHVGKNRKGGIQVLFVKPTQKGIRPYQGL